ncbi:MAG: hypothetical protein GY729_04495 [Desulfobacteraceae bacterium]|nr:hypothetical protein [Desulfobacteraceae bacterium]
MNKLVLIPSAKLIPVELQGDFGSIPSAMIPLDSKPALRYIQNDYRKFGYDFLIAVNENAEMVYNYCKSHQTSAPTTIVDVGKTDSLGMTIRKALENLKRFPDHLIINYADTFVGNEIKEENAVCYVKQDDVFRWTTFQLSNQNEIININEKYIDKKVNSNGLNVFVGVFAFRDVPLFIDKLELALKQERTELDPFYVALISYFNQIKPSQKTFLEVSHWMDFGHLDTYYDTKKKISLNARYFNTIKVDDQRGIITKKSSKSKKLINEIKWYLKLPVGLNYISPRILRYSLSFDEPSVEMEFYGYPALNDMYLFGDFEISVWNQIIEAIGNIRDDMISYQHLPEDQSQIKLAMQDMYEEKTTNRLKQIETDDRFSLFFADEVEINNRSVFGINKVLNLLSKTIKELQLYKIPVFSIIHGDLCLSNILYNRRNKIVRVIDPRGGFGTYDIYGDPRYDIAKLNHSIEGDYDFLVNGLFEFKLTGNSFIYKVQLQQKHKEIKKLFKHFLMEKWEVDYHQIKLIESLLFLSMVPLHSDRFNSQLCFIAKGLEIFTEVANHVLSE